MVDRLHARVLVQAVAAAYRLARFETRPLESPSAELHRARSAAFVACLARELRNFYAHSPDVEVLARGEPSKLFRRSELLFDVMAVRYRMVSAPRRLDVALPCVTASVLQVESELSEKLRSTLDDFNKLVLGSAPWSLFVGPLSAADECAHYLEGMKTSAACIPGRVVAAFIAHPSRWGNDGREQVLGFSWSNELGAWARAGDPAHDVHRHLLRVWPREGGFALQVAQTLWRSHEPHCEWLEHHAWDHAPSEDEVRDAEARAVADETHFGTCARCAQRMARGHMGEDACHACMTAAGVVF